MSAHKAATPNAEKGGRYLQQLDQALCNASWSEVTELARKVDKHAPERKCLTLAARAEVQVATASHRPSSASSATATATATSIHSLGEHVAGLVESIAVAEKSFPDDAFIACVCLAQIYWLQEEPQNALEALDNTAGATISARPGTRAGAAPLGWLEVCAVKGTFIRAACLDSLARQNEARGTYQAAVSHTPGYRTPELRKWTERLLARACMYSVKKMPLPTAQGFSETYGSFRAWGDFWQRAPSSLGSVTASRLDIPRKQVWKAYYDLLSNILQHGLLCGADSDTLVGPGVFSSIEERSSAKRRQRAEVLRVESTYESLLLEETRFPKASQTNVEVEEWTEQVISNWRIFTGPHWMDADLGDGGRQTATRHILDILYRAATKTFHSTSILRQLFTVHAALGEFDLAMHAFDSYMEIVEKGKARAQKTGRHEIGFDDDNTAMLTAAEAIRILCRYGDQDQAEKANRISSAMQRWLTQQRPATIDSVQTNGVVAENEASFEPTGDLLKKTTLAAAHRAIGVSQAHWASWTPESSSRSSLLAGAGESLRKALQYEPDNTDTAYSLALVLAQSRDISGSLEVLRSALDGSVMLEGDAAFHHHQERERKLLSLWHLLSLCLTAQDQFEAASQICEAAYNQIGSSEVLFGQTTLGDPETSSILPSSGIVSQMEGFEKESIVQMRMTQIVLFELMEGPDAAVDLTDGLLSLYSKLFGNPEHARLATPKPPQTAASATPSKLGGTLRSITGSIRPRSRSARSRRSSTERETIRQRSVTSADGAAPPVSDLRPATNGQAIGPPISITVTNENGTTAEKPHHKHRLHLPFRHEGGASISSRSPVRSIAEKPENEVPASTTAKAIAATDGSPEQPLEKDIHDRPPDQWPAPVGHSDQPPIQDLRLPAPHPAAASTVPESHLTPLHERRHKVGVLVKTWLFVAGLYIRADSYDDAQNAVDHAKKLTETLEVDLASSETGTNARRLFEKGWGGGKSVDQLWADVWSLKGQLASATGKPFQAMAAFEQALSYSPDHAGGIIGLSALLMDIFEQKIPLEEPLAPDQPFPIACGFLINEAQPSLSRPNTASTAPSRRPSLVNERQPLNTEHAKKDPTPAELNRLAARDRAYMLLSTLTKQGNGWDNSEAWLTLARAHELSREIGKAKQALWWVVELEDSRPLRSWAEAMPGGFTL